MRKGLMDGINVLIAMAVLCVAAHVRAVGLPYENDYAFGVDVSFAKQRVDQGRPYKDAHEVKTPLQIFRDHGYNYRTTGSR